LEEKSAVNSPMWMIESESADFHSWLQHTATSNRAEITFMLSRNTSSEKQEKKQKLSEVERTELKSREPKLFLF